MTRNIYTVTVKSNGKESNILFSEKKEMNKYLEGFEAVTISGDKITLDKSSTQIVKFCKD